jgi:hypothetical protein
MSISQVIALVNQMEAAGVVRRYAIGGAVGATFYLEPVATLDVDIFVAFQETPGKLLDPKPIIDNLTTRGGVVDREYVVIGGWPVQFLPQTGPLGPLVEEALNHAVSVNVEGVPARVFSAEHLAAIALQTGRAKDKAWLLQFLEAEVFDKQRFFDILHRHNLVEHWRTFERDYLKDGS